MVCSAIPSSGANADIATLPVAAAPAAAAAAAAAAAPAAAASAAAAHAYLVIIRFLHEWLLLNRHNEQLILYTALF